jgi:LPS-assembly protein
LAALDRIPLAVAILAALPAAWAQLNRPPGPPPPTQAEVPNAANPNQRLKVQRPDSPPPDEYWATSDTQEADGPLRHLRGHVRLETMDKKLEADAVDYNEDTGDAEASGHVRYENFTDGTKLYCDHAKYNVNSETGIFYEVSGTSQPKIVSRPGLLTTNNPFYFEGKWAERQEEKYIVHEGFVTDCKVPKPWWRLTGATFDIIPYDRAIAHRSVFRIRRLPLLYFPAYYKSLKKLPRQSGFMTPNIGRSSLYGGMLGLAYYWAINRSYDTLYRIQYFTARGFAHTLDLRGKVTPGTDFGFSLYGVNDRGISVGGGQVQKQGGLQFTFDGKSTLGDGWEARVRLDYLSSFLFRQSFTQSFHEAIFSESHSTGFLTKHWSSYAFTVDVDRDEEFLSTTPGNDIVIRKLPEVEFLSRDRQIAGGVLPVWFSLDSSAGFVDRTQPTFQTRQFVNRLDVYPQLTTALHFAGFNLTASVAARETEYGASQKNGVLSGSDILRSAREIRIELLPPALERIYKSPRWLGGEKVKHVIEPRIDYDFVDGIFDFNRMIRFDETDLMSDTNQVTVSVANRLFVKDKAGNVNEELSWEVAQSRYFDPTFGGAAVPGQRNVVTGTAELDGFAFMNGPRNYSPVVSTLRFQHVVGVEWRLDYDPLVGHVSSSTFSGNIRFSKYFISLGHNEVRANPNVSPNSDQINGLLAVGNQNRKGWNAAFNIYYDYRKGIMDFATTEVSYNTDCCGISVEYRRFNFGSRDDTQYRVAFAVSNIGSFGTLRKQERIF